MKTLSEIAFFTSQLSEMTAFYQSLLGKEPEAQSDGMSIFMIGQTKLFIHRTYQPEKGELAPENHFAYQVEDVDLACRKLEEKGFQIEVNPKEYYWGYSAYLRDPDGTLIELNKPGEE